MPPANQSLLKSLAAGGAAENAGAGAEKLRVAPVLRLGERGGGADSPEELLAAARAPAARVGIKIHPRALKAIIVVY